MRKTRMLGIVLVLVLTVSLIPFGVFKANAEGGSTAPTIEKPVYVTVTDANGTPKAGATVQVLDSDGTVVQTISNAGESFAVFLPEGTYSLKVSDAPSGFVPDSETATVTVSLTESEEKDDLPANTVYDDSHPEICVPNLANLASGHVGIERYTVEEPEGNVTVWCFNQNYDNPYSSAPSWNSSYDPSQHQYKRLVGTPELLYNLAQYKSDTITPQELYDHVLAIMYLKDSIQQEYGFDDALMEFLVGRAIKTFTDPKAFLNSHTDDDGNTVMHQGTVWGAVVSHAKRNHQKININEKYPEYREAYNKLISSSDHPADYFLYIYYPENWETGNNDTDQCLMSAFTVPPVRTTLKLLEATTVEITKTWADENDQDGCRPTADEYTAMVKLYADGTDVTEAYEATRTVIDNGDNTYTVKFADLPKMDGEREIAYTIRETNVPNYTADKTEAANGEAITNRHIPEPTEIPVTKEWQDGENADGIRPDSITVRLYDGETEVKSATVTPDADGNWSYTFKDLPKNKNGKEIQYTINEDPVPEYQAEIENYKITNTHVPVVEIPIEKKWDDADDQDGVRPKNITVLLYADETKVQSATVVPDANGNWKYTFKNLPKFKDDGSEIVYTIDEETVPAYDKKIEGYIITNKHEPEKTEVNGKKTWQDDYDHDAMRPKSITIRLFANGKEIKSVKVTEADGWKWSFTDLPKYEKGKEIKYTIKEDRVLGYTAKVVGYNVINSYSPPTGDASQPELWIALLAISLLTGIGLLVLEWINKRTA